MEDIYNLSDSTIGDVKDDLVDITTDFLEIRWRIGNNSLDDGLWYSEFIFKNHIVTPSLFIKLY
jgi:hypothetical protein